MKYSKEGITIGVFFDVRYVCEDETYPVKIRIRYGGKRKDIPTGVYMRKNEWEVLETTKNRTLLEHRRNIENTFEKIKTHVEKLASSGGFSFENLNSRLSSTSERTVNLSFKHKIEKLRENGSIRTSASYRNALNSFVSFSGESIQYKDITVDWLNAYEKFMLKDRSYTTIGIYLRYLRAIFNEAIESGFIEAAVYPFKKSKYSIPTSVKRKLALTLSQIKLIFYYDNGSEATARYRDLWLFSYLANGANFNDILRLRYENIKGKEIHFLRKKTEHTLKTKKDVVVFITPEMSRIIEKWGNQKQSAKNYIFPYLNGIDSIEQEYKIIQDVIKRTNKHLKKITQELNMPHVTTYTARHSFATVLKRSGANIAFISESLGHNDLKTTENYLASFESEEREKNARLLTEF